MRRPEEKHGMRYTTLYTVWSNMIQRCTNPKNRKWKDYGGRGVTVCDRWLRSFVAFHSDMGNTSPGLTIERVNNDKGYEPGNCRWATQSEQAQNRRIRSDSSTGLKGISWRFNRSIYDVRVTREGRRVHIGSTPDLEVAKQILSKAQHA